MRLILDFVDKYDDRVLYNNIDDIAIDDNVFLYHWCKCSHFVHKRQLKATISPEVTAWLTTMMYSVILKVFSRHR